jgi:hypothetical protein
MPIKSAIKKYTETYLVLDKDASSKAISITMKIDRSIRVRLTSSDLKSLSTNQILSVLGRV